MQLVGIERHIDNPTIRVVHQLVAYHSARFRPQHIERYGTRSFAQLPVLNRNIHVRGQFGRALAGAIQSRAASQLVHLPIHLRNQGQVLEQELPLLPQGIRQGIGQLASGIRGRIWQFK